MLTTRHPELREPVRALLAKLRPAVTDGGAVALTDLVLAVAGDRLSAASRAQLDARGDAALQVVGQGARFSNEGPEVKMALKLFNLVLPRRLEGAATLTANGGVAIEFDPKATMVASKLLASVRFVRVELGPDEVLVTMSTRAFDQRVELR